MVLRLAIVMLATVLGCGASAAQTRKAAPPVPEPIELLRSTKTWGYQLQNLNIGQLAASPYDTLVLDTNLARADVQRLKRKPDGKRRLVLAYINIGEAEDYRPYWKKVWEKQPPEWLGASNAFWKGDHRVRHWHPDWQKIVFGSPLSLIGGLIAAGFDGAYLDRVDVYQFWCGERADADLAMIDFVVSMSRWAKTQKPGFLILPQNGEELLANPDYVAAIDGLGKEDLVFGDRGNDVANYDTRVERALELMASGHKAGLTVLAIEYAREPKNQALSREVHGKQPGHVLYFGPRSLAYLGQMGPLHKEDGSSEPYYAAQGPRGCGDRPPVSAQ